MIGMGAGTMQDQTRGRGASFSADECKLLNSALLLSVDVLGLAAPEKPFAVLTVEEVEMMKTLSAKCERGAGL